MPEKFRGEMSSSAFSWLLSRRSSPSKKEPSANLSSRQEEEFGLTEQLREFVRSFTAETFRDFHLPDRNSNVTDKHEDLTPWQEKHALLVLSSVKEIAKIRYNLCPRIMSDKDFWARYFLLVKKYAAPYEMHAMQKENLKVRAMKDQEFKDKNTVEVEMMMTKSVENGPSMPNVDP